MNLKRFPFSSSSVQMDEDLKTGSNCKMFEGRISFIHVGWLLRLFRLISWCWCRRVKNRWWDFTCGNVGRVRVVAISVLQNKRLCLIIYAWCSNCLVRIHLLLVMFWASFCKYLPDWSTTSSIQLLVEPCTNWSEDFASWLVNVTGARKR